VAAATAAATAAVDESGAGTRYARGVLRLPGLPAAVAASMLTVVALAVVATRHALVLPLSPF
jgi:hypothetical protein